MRQTLLLSSKVIVLLVAVSMIAGCTVGFYKRWPTDKSRIEELSKDLERLQRMRDDETRELQDTMRLLERRLKKELGEKEIRLEMAERGLVITFVEEVLFDSGKAKIKEGAYEKLQKVARVLREKVPEKNIAIEGHTDDQPIKYSGWKSNWELSTARATSVLHYLVDEASISPERLQATGYGEYRPVDTNMDEEGKKKNRRVEIIILPRVTKADLESLERKRNRAFEEQEEMMLK